MEHLHHETQEELISWSQTSNLPETTLHESKKNQDFGAVEEKFMTPANLALSQIEWKNPFNQASYLAWHIINGATLNSKRLFNCLMPYWFRTRLFSSRSYGP